MKMKGDNYSYLAEVDLPDTKEVLVKSAEKAYGRGIGNQSVLYMAPT